MIKKFIIVPTAIFLTIAANAYADSGFYVGIGAGYGSISTSTTNGYSYLDGSSNKSGGNMLGSIYAGYDFSHYVGVQMDYDYIANIQFSSGTNQITGVQNSFNANEQIIDLAITGHLPFALFANSLSGISLFGKLGIGYTNVGFSGGAVGSGQGLSYTQNLPSFAQSIVPILGIGAEYGIDSVGVRVEYNYIGTTTVSTNNSNIMNINNNIGLVSVFYHF